MSYLSDITANVQDIPESLPELRRRFRIIDHLDDAGPCVMVSREWSGEPPDGWHPEDDLVLMIDPDIDRVELGRFVNRLRDAGHAVEISWPIP